MKEAPDNLVSKTKVRILDALCEGPIEGFVSGNDNYGPQKSTYINETVLMNANNTFNFNLSGDSVFSFALGETGQDAMPNFGYVENFIPLPGNTEIKQLVSTPLTDNDYKDLVISLNNKTYPDANSLRVTVRVPQLISQVDPSSSNNLKEPEVQGYQVKFVIQASLNGAAYTQIGEEMTIFGKTTSGYSKSIEIPLPSDGSNYLSWKIRFRRTTLNISTLKVANALFVDSVSVISGSEYKYPNTVLVGMEFDSEKLGGGFPSRIYEVYGLKVKIPNTYNPVTRAYTGIWLGAFKDEVAQGVNVITNPNFQTDTSSWTAFRSTITRSTVSPPGAYAAYGVATVNIAAAGEKSYFSAYQTPAAPQSTTYIVKGYYKVSNSALNFKIGINNVTIDEYRRIGSATDWTAFETKVISAGYSGSNWVEFAAQRAGECLTGDALYITGIEVYTPADDGKEYTNNPAWIFYDLCTNTRYGLGNFMRPEWIDKWTLYQIAQYCDEMVDDGAGGQEPRFTCNVVINQQDDAYRVLLNMVSVFRGMLYFSNGRLFPVQDALKTFQAQFTNANVIDGIFNYGSSSKRTRHTVALVRWNDPKNFYRETTEVVEDVDGITKYGYQTIEMTAFACTSQGQAYRTGKWALVSEALETETVTFKTAIEGTYLRPGDVFQIFDNVRYDLNQGGRLLSVDGLSGVQLDRDVAIEAGSVYDLTVTTPRYYLESTGDLTGSDQIGAIRNIQVTTSRVNTTNYTGKNIQTQTSLGTEIGPGTTWTLAEMSGNSSSTVRPKQYRCLAVSEYSPFEMEVLGLEYVTGKFGLIETGFSVINNTVYENAAESPPKPGGFSDGTYQRLGVNYIVDTEQDFVRDYIELDWFPVESNLLKFYRVRVTTPGGSAQIITDTLSDTYTYALSGCRPVGQYLFSVTSVGKGLSESAALTGGYTVLASDGISSLSFDTPSPITGMYGTPYDFEWLNSGFETRTPTISLLRNPGDYDGSDPRLFYVTGFEFQICTVGTNNTVLDLGKVAAEKINLTSANISSISNARSFDIKATPLSCLGSGQAGFAAYKQTMVNKPPLNSVTSTFTNAGGGINFNIIPNALDSDISGVYLWASTNAGLGPTFSNQTLVSDSLGGLHPLSSTGSYYVWHSLIDSYSTTDCTIQGPSGPIHYVGVPANSIADGAINSINKFISSVQPIQVLGTLPSVLTATQGQLVFLTTDLKLWRFNGSAWTLAVDGADIEAGTIITNKLTGGIIQAGYVAADAISGDNIRAGSITANKITVDYLSAITANLGHVTAGTGEFGNATYTKTVIKENELRQGSFLSRSYNSAGIFITEVSVTGGNRSKVAIEAAGFDTTSNAGIRGYAPGGVTDAAFFLGTASPSVFRSGIEMLNAGGILDVECNSYFDRDISIGAGADPYVYINDNNSRLVFGGTHNQITFAAGTTNQIVFGSDTNLYRNGASQLKTDDDFYALSLTATSSLRYKKNIRPLTGCLDKIDLLTGVYFDWTIKDKQDDIGFIAEDVEKVLPSIVARNNSGEIEGMDYGRITAVLVEAIKELRKETNDLRKEVGRLKSSHAI